MTAAAIIEEGTTTVKTLRIAKDLALPLDAVTQTLAAIGRKGAGKTYLASMIAEQMLDAAAQVIALDPVGNWWGLRVGADGKKKGKESFVIGGEHGDVPLVPEAGARIARLLVERRVSAVLDVSGFRQGERKRFAADFGEELFHLKKGNRAPVHLFVEEAQLFAPQRAGPDEARMLGAYENIIRLGRNYGVGATLVTQRPQSVNKEVLSQVECLCVLQVNGSHERKALEEWVQEAGADRKLVGELPGLSRGEGYVWSPSWLRIFQRVRFAQKATFDASATPEVGKVARAASLSAVDVEALRTDLAEVVKKAEADDPKALRRRIAELERVLAQANAMAERIDKKLERAAPPPKRVEVPVLSERDLKRIDKAAEVLANSSAVVAALLLDVREQLRAADAPPPAAARQAAPLPPARRPIAAVPPPRSAAPRPTPGAAPPAGDLGKGERRVLTAAAQHPEGVTREQLTVLTGYKRSSRDTYLQRLRAFGFVQDGDRIVATDAGVAALGDGFEPLPTGPELLEHWRRTLGPGELACLEVAVKAYPEPVDRDAISEATGYQRSSRDTYLQRLRSRQLIAEPGRGMVRASDTLFLAR
jgi:uncharacterized protein